MDVPNENVEDEREEEANPGQCSIIWHRAGVKTGFVLCSLQLTADLFVALNLKLWLLVK